MAELSQNEVLLLGQLGYTLYKEGQYQSAISIFEGLAEIQPDFPQFHSVLAVLYHLTNRPDVALQYGIKALEQKPHDVALLMTIAEIYLALQRPDHAQEILSRASAEARRTNHPAFPRIQLLQQSAR